jgi:uncharacterized protein YdaL
MFRVGLSNLLNIDKLAEYNLKPTFIEEFLKQSRYILTLDYNQFKEYILKIDNQKESTIEHEVLLFILSDLNFYNNETKQPVENLFYNTNQSREVAIAIKQLFDLSMFDGSYGIDYLQAES